MLWSWRKYELRHIVLIPKIREKGFEQNKNKVICQNTRTRDYPWEYFEETVLSHKAITVSVSIWNSLHIGSRFKYK
jgi:hypothetical protein